MTLFINWRVYFTNIIWFANYKNARFVPRASSKNTINKIDENVKTLPRDEKENYIFYRKYEFIINIEYIKTS